MGVTNLVKLYLVYIYLKILTSLVNITLSQSVHAVWRGVHSTVRLLLLLLSAGLVLTILVKLVLVKCQLVKKTQKIRLFSEFCLESVALWSVSGPGFYSSVSLHR